MQTGSSPIGFNYFSILSNPYIRKTLKKVFTVERTVATKNRIPQESYPLKSLTSLRALNPRQLLIYSLNKRLEKYQKNDEGLLIKIKY